MPRYVVIAMLVSALWSAACQDTPCENDLSCEGKDEVCNPASRRCEARGATTPPGCTGDGECSNGRACVSGVCRFAATCLNLGGSWEVWHGDPGAGGTLQGSEPWAQTDCLLSGVPDVAGDFLLTATVGRLGELQNVSLEADVVTIPCTGAWNGDDTMRVGCADAGVFNFYARPVALDGLTPQPCGGGCTCQNNSIGVPVCTP